MTPLGGRNLARAPAPHGEGQDGEIEIRQFFELDDFGPSKAIDSARGQAIRQKTVTPKKLGQPCRFRATPFVVQLERQFGPLQTKEKKITMRFLSIYKNVERSTPPSPEEMARVGAMVEEAIRSGALITTEGCLPSALGARVRISDGKFTVTDGPFTEAKEVIGGFAIFNANSKEEAIEKAKEFLHVMGQGETELRQLFEAPQKVQENYETLAKLRAGSAARA